MNFLSKSAFRNNLSPKLTTRVFHKRIYTFLSGLEKKLRDSFLVFLRVKSSFQIALKIQTENIMSNKKKESHVDNTYI